MLYLKKRKYLKMYSRKKKKRLREEQHTCTRERRGKQDKNEESWQEIKKFIIFDT